MNGTVAAPEPVASRARFFEDEKWVDLARSAGFSDARVVAAEEERYARTAGLSEDVVAVFHSLGRGPLLLARKSGARPGGRGGPRHSTRR